MTRRRWVLVGMTIASLVWALGGEWLSITHGVAENHLLDATVGLTFFGAGLVALDRRPGNIIGPLMIAYAITWFLGNWQNLDVQPFFTLGFVGGLLGTPFLVHIFVAYPSGSIRTVNDRALAWTVYVVTAAVAAVIVLTWDPQAFFACTCPATYTMFPSEPVFRAAQWVGDFSPIVLVPWFLASIVLRWRRGSPAERRDLLPLWIASAILAVVYLIGAFASSDPRDPFAYLLWEIRSVLQISVPILFLWGLLSTRLARSAVGDLVLELDRSLPPGELRSTLARSIGDPTLELVYALQDEDRWVGPDGQPVTLPDRGHGHAARAITIVERDDQPVAALIHDPGLDEGLVRAAGAAAGMSIENERLHAEVRAQLEEVRASRQRIVEAGDRERRRVERNLHDGAQQRLVSLSLALAMLRDRDGVDTATVSELEGASDLLKQAIVELRELARGIHPAILSDEGLAAAVDSLADRSSIPVRIRAAVDERLPERIEATAYFVVAESLANVTKYAEASSAVVAIARRNGSLHIEVVDDGVGGADVTRGSGLRGLADRVAAVGGTLRVDSPLGQGTVIMAEMPLDA